MVGLGESFEEMTDALGQLRDAGVSVITVGQYLRPTVNHLPIVRYWHPESSSSSRSAATPWGSRTWPVVRSCAPATTPISTCHSPPTARPAPCRCSRSRGAPVVQHASRWPHERTPRRADHQDRLFQRRCDRLGMVVLVGVLSLLALTQRGRRSLMPAVAILLGAVIVFTSLSDAFRATFR